VQTITSSVDFVTGSTRFGSIIGNTHVFSGSMAVSGGASFNTAQNFTVRSTSTGWISSFTNDYNNTSYIGVDDGGVYIQPTSKGTKLVAGNGTTYLYVTSSGVGIGIANPSRTLDVTGTFRIITPNRSFFVTSNAYSISDGTLSSGIGMDGDGLYLGNVTSATGWTISNPQVTIRSSGNVGIGTSSPSTLLHINTAARTSGTNVNILTLSDTVTGVQTSGFGVRIVATSNNGAAVSAISFDADGGTNNDTSISLHTQSTAGGLTERMKITRLGNVIIGADRIFGINTADGSDNGYLALCGASGDGSGRGGHIYLSGNERAADPGTAVISAGNISGGAVIFRTGADVERMRIDSVGRITINSPSTYVLTVSNTTNTSGQGVFVTSLGSNNNNTTSYHYIAATGGADRYYLYGNGTYTTVSDQRLKKNITTITDTYLDKIKDLRIVNYNWNDQPDGSDLELGMIAQEVEEIIPSIVYEGREQEDGNIYKGIQVSSLPYILIKAIQELKAEFDEYKATHP
jgi:hypothetical protein